MGNGNVLRVDLSTSSAKREELDPKIKELMIGGRGLAIAYLYNELAPQINPLQAENKIMLAPGVLAGSGAQGLSRWLMVTKSPLTGLVGRSVVGGSMGAYLQYAGIDLLIIEGEAAEPCYIYINADGAVVKSARDLWGLHTGETEQLLQERHGRRARVAAIGPAGENGVLYAAVIHQKRAAARCGVGTVMGSKKLKAVVLDFAPRRLELPQKELFQKALAEQVARLRENPRRKALSREGTAFMVEMAVELGMFPVRNFQSGGLEGVENLFADSFQKFKVSNKACYHCMTKCGQVYKVTEGPFKGVQSEGPEYETIWAFGGQVGNTDPAAIIAFDRLCDQLGLDTISTGNCIGFACELLEKKILSPEQLDGLDLGWGNVDAFLELTNRIARGEGLGRILGKGVRQAAKEFGNGAAELAMHVKGSELPAYDPRAIKGYGLSYATSNIGGNHMYGRPRPEIYGARDGFGWTEEGKGDMVAKVQIRQAFDEVLICCTFGMSGMDDPLLSRLIAGATGWKQLADSSTWDAIGERIVTLERLFNMREGLDKARDHLPARFFSEPLKDAGLSSGQFIHSLKRLFAEYYEQLGYSPEGIPYPKRVQSLRLTEIIKGE